MVKKSLKIFFGRFTQDKRGFLAVGGNFPGKNLGGVGGGVGATFEGRIFL